MFFLIHASIFLLDARLRGDDNSGPQAVEIILQYDLRREFKSFPGISPVEIKFEFNTTKANHKKQKEVYERVYRKGGA